MSELTITEVLGPEAVTFGDGKTMNRYDLIMDNGTTATAWRPQVGDDGKPVPGPKVGAKGTVENGKFKKTPSAGGGGGGGRGRSPEELRSIIRQHSQEMAIRYAALSTTKAVEKLGDLKKLIDWFEDDATRVKPEEHPTPESIAAPPQQDFTPPPAPDDDEIPF